jgi:1-acyl-sn-glycerol-3-phosphate acyltransferase
MTEKKWYKFFYAIVRPFVGLYYPMKFIGRENIPEGGALICANHSSAVDPFFLAFALGWNRQIRAMAKESLLNLFFVGKILKLVGTFGVKRGASDIHAVKYALEQLKQGEYVVLFPEGTRVKSREEGEPKTGAAMLACRTGVNVVPVYIPMHKRPFRINRVYIGKPYVMKPQGKRATSQDYEVFTAELMDKIYDLGDAK